MEVALAAFSGLGSAAAGVASFGSTAMSVLSGVATVGSVLMGAQSARAELQAGQAAMGEATTQAQIAQIEGDRAATESAARAVELQKEHLRKVGAARVAFAGSGLDISSGQLGSIERSLGHELDYGLSIEAGNQRIARAKADVTSGQYELAGANAVRAAEARASSKRLGGVLEGARGLLSFAKRG
jgi:hypothetical protein